MSGNPSNAFGPVAALRAIQRVCADRGMTPAQRLVIVQVVLYADNATGLAWAPYRTIQRATGLASGTIGAALQYADGEYLRRHAVGRHGAVQYQVLPRHYLTRGSTAEAPPSASASDALARQSARSSASGTDAILTPSSSYKHRPSKQSHAAASLEAAGGMGALREKEKGKATVGRRARARRSRAGVPTSKKRVKKKTLSPDPRVRQFLGWFCDEYETSQGRAYVVCGGKDGALIKGLLKRLEIEQLQQAARTMLADSWARDKADIGLLAAKINSWLSGANPKRDGKRGGFTPAKASEDYTGLAQRFG